MKKKVNMRWILLIHFRAWGSGGCPKSGVLVRAPNKYTTYRMFWGYVKVIYVFKNYLFGLRERIAVDQI